MMVERSPLMPHRCIVIGASAGGYEVVVDIVSQFPADLPAPVFIVMHIPAYHPSPLPHILSKAGTLPALHPEDGTKMEDSHIYVAPPDHHLLVDDGYIAVKKGPKENGFRPSIDALFRSAAYSYGPGTVGVVLSGALHDGASGLWSIKRLGGIAIVQDPHEAEYPSMPRSALEYVDADFKLRSHEVSPLLVRLAQEPVTPAPGKSNTDIELDERVAKEVQIAAGTNISSKSILELGELAPFACPECHGTLVRILEDKITRFRCHTGHGYTEDALLEAIMQSTGEQLWQVTRGLQEGQILLEHMGKHMQEAGERHRSQKAFVKAQELGKRASRFAEMAQEHESLSENKLDDSEDE
jgi:two-component system chemotaxis response regulator CheB